MPRAARTRRAWRGESRGTRECAAIHSLQRVAGRLIAAIVALAAAACGPPAQVLDRVPTPIRPAWIAAQPESTDLDEKALAQVDAAIDAYGERMIQVRRLRLAPLAQSLTGIDPTSCDVEALRRFISEARAVRLELDGSERAMLRDLANHGVVDADISHRWALRREVTRDLELLSQAGFGSPRDLIALVREFPPATFTAGGFEPWADAYRGWLAPQLRSLNDALLTRPLDRRLQPPPVAGEDGSTPPDPIDEGIKERLRELTADAIAMASLASDEDAWRTEFRKRAETILIPPTPTEAPRGARYPDGAGNMAALFLPAPPTDAEWAALAKVLASTDDEARQTRESWEAIWMLGVESISAMAKHELSIAQDAASDAARGTPRQIAQRLHSAMTEADASMRQLVSDADERMFSAVGARASPAIQLWWRLMRLAPPVASDVDGVCLGRAFGMGACRRDRSLVELSAIEAAEEQQLEPLLEAMAASAPDRIDLAMECIRGRLAGWGAAFETIVSMQRDPAAVNPTRTRAGVSSAAALEARFVAMQDSLAADCVRAVPEIAKPLRSQVRALAWPEFFSGAHHDPAAQRPYLEVRSSLVPAPGGFDADALDGAIERELVRIDASAAAVGWSPAAPFADPEGDWALILRKDPELFAAVWARTVATDRAVRAAVADEAHPHHDALVRYVDAAAGPGGP